MPHQFLVKSDQNYVAIHLCGITRATKVSYYLNDNGPCGRKTNTVEPYIRTTCPCDLYPLASHFHIVKLGFTREFLFINFVQKHRMLDLVSTASVRRFYNTCAHDLCFEQK